MLIKKLIQRLLDSRTTPAQAAHASKPVSGIPVEYNPSPSIGIWGQVLPDSIAVSDGYIWAEGRTSAIGGFLQVNSQAMQITTSGTSIGEGEILNIFIPVSKGQGFTVYARSMNQIVVRLVRTIGGGGYNILLWRALPCLRALSLFSPRSSFRTNPNGSAANPIHQSGFSSQTARKNTFLQGMVTWVSTSLTRAQITASMYIHSVLTVPSSQGQLLRSHPQQVLILTLASSLLRRVTRSLSPVLLLNYGSRQRWEANSNLSTGGALC